MLISFFFPYFAIRWFIFFIAKVTIFMKRLYHPNFAEALAQNTNKTLLQADSPYQTTHASRSKFTHPSSILFLPQTDPTRTSSKARTSTNTEQEEAIPVVSVSNSAHQSLHAGGLPLVSFGQTLRWSSWLNQPPQQPPGCCAADRFYEYGTDELCY